MPTLRDYNFGMTGEFGEELYDPPIGEFGELLYDPVTPEATPWWELPGPEDKPITETRLPTFTNVRPTGWGLQPSAAKAASGTAASREITWSKRGAKGARPGGGRPTLASMMAKREEERAKLRAAKKEAAQAKVEAGEKEDKEQAARSLEERRYAESLNLQEEARELEQERWDKMYELNKYRAMKPVWRIP